MKKQDIFNLKGVAGKIEDGEMIFSEYLADINHTDSDLGDNLLMKYLKATNQVEPKVVKHICTTHVFQYDKE